jgi:hypothetical protein
LVEIDRLIKTFDLLPSHRNQYSSNRLWHFWMTRKEVSFRLWAGRHGNCYIRKGLHSARECGLYFNSNMDAVVALCVLDPNRCGKKTHGGSVLEIMILCMHAIPQVLQPLLLLLLLLLLLKCSSYPNQHTPSIDERRNQLPTLTSSQRYVVSVFWPSRVVLLLSRLFTRDGKVSAVGCR